MAVLKKCRHFSFLEWFLYSIVVNTKTQMLCLRSIAKETIKDFYSLTTQ